MRFRPWRKFVYRLFMLLIGIDEAGYGPWLGPLCHGLCVVRCPVGAIHAAASAIPGVRADPVAPDLWRLWAPAVSRCPAPAGAVAVDDSKKLHAGPHKRQRLFRSVACFLHALEKRPSPAPEPRAPGTFCSRLLPREDVARIEADPWGQPHPNENELFASEMAVPASSPSPVTALRARLRESGTELLAYHARALSARDFNARLERLGNKAELNWERGGTLLREALSLAAPGEAVRAVVDRQGGRKFYGPLLRARFDGACVQTESEAKSGSVYRLDFRGVALRVAFREKAEAVSLPVALASMAAKLARELLMARFNAFFCSRGEKIAPTAGYPADAKRFLEESAALRRRLAIPDGHLIRQR